MKSVMQSEKECYICGQPYGLECHHVFHGRGNRKISEKYGYKVWLCPYHHRDGKNGVHFNREADLMLKRYGQKVFEMKKTREEFIKLFGKSYL